jgi:hypothetical protein
MKKIAFHANQLSLRGTEIALFSYAKYNEEILGNKSVIFSSPNNNLDALDKFQSRIGRFGFQALQTNIFGLSYSSSDTNSRIKLTRGFNLIFHP